MENKFNLYDRVNISDFGICSGKSGCVLGKYVECDGVNYIILLDMTVITPIFGETKAIIVPDSCLTKI